MKGKKEGKSWLFVLSAAWVIFNINYFVLEFCHGELLFILRVRVGTWYLLRFKEKNDRDMSWHWLKQKHKRLEDELGEAIKDKYNLDIEVHQCNSNVQRKNQGGYEHQQTIGRLCSHLWRTEKGGELYLGQWLMSTFQ